MAPPSGPRRESATYPRLIRSSEPETSITTAIATSFGKTPAENTSVGLMNGAPVWSTGGIGNLAPAVWSVAATGDYNGDGNADILWRDTSGNTAIWVMSGTTVSSSAPVGNIPTTWTVQSVNAD